MKLRLLMVAFAIAFGIAGVAAAQDAAPPDSVKIVVADAQMSGPDLKVALELHVFASPVDLIGMGMGFDWNSANMQMDSAVASAVAKTSFNQVFLYKTDLATTNAARQFQLGTFRVFEPGLAAQSAFQLMATYYFTYTGWTTADTIIIDTVQFSSGTNFKFVDKNNASYTPVWKGQLIYADPSGIDVIGGNGSLPNDYALEQNYPNPFNPTTNIRFALPRAGEYSLTIYNILGQKVEEINDVADAPGEYEVVWNADAYGSGIYFYRLRAGDFVDTKKMMLLK